MPADSVAALIARLAGTGVHLRLAADRRRPIRYRQDRRSLRLHPLVFAHADAVSTLAAVPHTGSRTAAVRDLQRRTLAAVSTAGGLGASPAQAYLPVCPPAGRDRLLTLDRALDRAGILLEPNDNRHRLVGLRRRPGGGLICGVQYRLLFAAGADRVLLDFCRSHGRRGRRQLQDLFAAVADRLREEGGDAALGANASHDDPGPLPTIGPACDLGSTATEIHARYFADLPPLPVAWARDPGARRLRSIRFGSFRAGSRPLIRIHPRLRRPWVARCFLDHVLHHEYCHWRQQCEPVPGERSHSARFQAWERAFPEYAAAIAWQRAHLARLLAP